MDVDVSRGIGIWMSALGALVAFVGAFIGFRNTGLDTEYEPVAGGPRPDREIPPPGDVSDTLTAMDFGRFKTGDWLVIVGGVMMLIAGFLDWFDAGPVSPNAFDFTVTGLIPWLLLAAAAVIAFLVAGDVVKAGLAPWPVILLALTGTRRCPRRRSPHHRRRPERCRRPRRPARSAASAAPAACGWRRSAACVATAGGVMMFRAADRRMSDLPDLQKIRDAFKT